MASALLGAVTGLVGLGWGGTPDARAHAQPAEADDALVAQVLDLTNRERQNAGLDALVLSPELREAAQGYSQVLATGDCFSHTCGPVPDFAERDAQAGYNDWTSIGENIAGGHPTPEAVVAGWMASPGHRANILSTSFTEIGIGVTSGPGPYGWYWTEEFGARPDAADDTSSP